MGHSKAGGRLESAGRTPKHRAARLPAWLLVPGMLVLALGFVSGVLLWIAQSGAGTDPDGTAPAGGALSVQFWVKVHGALNPLACVFLGSLLPRHVRVGLHLEANRTTGFPMLIVMVGLALTGAALYYAGGDTTRSVLAWTHRALGLALPLTLAAHWIQAWRWIRRMDAGQPDSPPG